MKRILIGGALVIGALCLAGCAAAPGSSDLVAEAPAPMSDSQIPGSDSQVPGSQLTEGRADGLASDSAALERRVVVTGSMTVTVDDPAAAATEASAIVEAAGGRIDGRSESGRGEDGERRAYLTMRIPSEKVNDSVEQLRGLGEVTDISIDKQDVTAVAQDLDARITALQASVTRLIDLMSRAATTADLIAIETSLSERQANLESLQAQKRALDDQVDLSTITLSLQTPAAVAGELPGDFLGGLSAGWSGFVTFLGGLAVVIGVLLPWLIFLAGFSLGVTFLVRWILRRRSRPETPSDPAA